jgi:hypothetical protein
MLLERGRGGGDAVTTCSMVAVSVECLGIAASSSCCFKFLVECRLPTGISTRTRVPISQISESDNQLVNSATSASVKTHVRVHALPRKQWICRHQKVFNGALAAVGNEGKVCQCGHSPTPNCPRTVRTPPPPACTIFKTRLWVFKTQSCPITDTQWWAVCVTAAIKVTRCLWPFAAAGGWL